jgi:hypothetical protein
MFNAGFVKPTIGQAPKSKLHPYETPECHLSPILDQLWYSLTTTMQTSLPEKKSLWRPEADQRHKFETDNETKNIINALQQAPNIAHQIFYPLLTHCLGV